MEQGDSKKNSWDIASITSLFEAVDVSVYVSDPVTYELLYMNPHMRKVFGEHTGELCHKALQGLDKPCPFCTNKVIFDSGSSESVVWDHLNEMDNRWYRCVDKAIDWVDGRKVRLELAMDIDGLKRAHLNILEILDSIPLGILMVGLDKGVRWMNTEGLKMVGARSLSDVQGKICHEFLCPAVESNCPVLDLHQEVNQSERTVLRLDGTKFPVLKTVRKMLVGEEEVLLEAFMDIHDRKKAQAELEEREEMFRSLSETAQDGIIVLDDEERIQVWNRASERIFGWSEEEVLGRKLHELVIVPEMQDVHGAWFRTFVDTGRIDHMLELSWLRKDGERIPVEVSLSAFSSAKKRHLVGMVRDISERKEAERALKKAKKEAEAAAEAKGQFLANMSHEIRTPMNGVIGMTSLLLDLDLTDEQRSYAETIESSARHLMSIINEVLDFSKIEAGKLDLEKIDFDLRHALDEMDEILALKAQQKGLEYVCLVRPGVPSLIKGDPGRLRQILINLVGNSIKFTEKGSVEIVVDLISQNEKSVNLRFSVRDTGIGIETDKLLKIFSPFEQADGSTTRRFGGTGLGLSISSELVQMMGGELKVESEPGKGSVFWFEVVFELQQIKDFVHSEKDVEQLRKLRVLVVDDNRTNLEVLDSMLGRWGCEAVMVQQPALVIEKMHEAVAKNRPFDVVILDKCMPDLDGEKLGKLIKKDSEINSAHLVMLSSIAKRGDVSRLEDMGFSAYLVKPVKYDLLRSCMLNLVGIESRKPDESKNNVITKHKIMEEEKKNSRILLVEDNLTNQRVATALLGKFGLRADVVGSGEEALALLAKQRFDLVLMDVQMPGIDGYETTGIIRDSASGVIFHEVPIVAMTGHAMKGDRDKCLNAGMNDYITKPVDPKELIEKVLYWLSATRGG